MPELLSPAGNPKKLKAALLFGADAVYLAGQSFGMRSQAGNFTIPELYDAVELAHSMGRKVYLTLNTMPRTNEYPALRRFLDELRGCRLDAVIVADLGVLATVKEMLPDMEIHISTQASIISPAAARAYAALGARRLVLARELQFSEIRAIRDALPREVELEAFIHGSMCVSYSGRCLLANMMNGRDGNRGTCSQPCRWHYTLYEEKRPDFPIPIEQTDLGTFIMSSRDMCMIGHIPELMESGIDSFKIEGRMKTALYVATVARTYRIAIDDYLESPEKYQSKMEWYKSEIRKCTHREYITGFYFHKPGTESQVYGSNTYVKPYTYLGTVGAVRGDGLVHLEQKNKFSVGETIEIMKPDGRNLRVEVKGIFTEDGTAQESAPHPKQQLWVDLGGMAEPQDILRREDEALDL